MKKVYGDNGSKFKICNDYDEIIGIINNCMADIRLPCQIWNNKKSFNNTSTYRNHIIGFHNFENPYWTHFRKKYINSIEWVS